MSVCLPESVCEFVWFNQCWLGQLEEQVVTIVRHSSRSSGLKCSVTTWCSYSSQILTHLPMEKRQPKQEYQVKFQLWAYSYMGFGDGLYVCVYVYGCVCVIRWRLLMPCGVRPGCPLLVRRGRMGVSWLRTFPVLCPTSAPDYQWVSAWLTCPDPALTVPYAWQPINMLLSCRDLPQNVHKPIMTFSQPIMSRQLHSPWQTDRSFVQSHIQV